MISVIYRLIIFLWGGASNFNSLSSGMYEEIFRVNFFSFLKYEHTKPILIFLRDYFSYLIYPSNYRLVNFVVISFLDVLSVLALFKLLIVNVKSMRLCFIVSCVLTISLVTWEYWREASHYDHLFIPIFIFCVYSTFTLREKSNIINTTFFLFTHMMLIVTHSFGIIFCLISILFLTDQSIRKKVLITLGFFVLYTLVTLNNAYRFNIPLISTVGGQNQLQLVWSKEYDFQKMKTKLEELKAPLWYAKCFEDAYRIGGKVFSVYGLCYPNPIENSEGAIAYLETIASEYNKPDFTKVINSDISLIKAEPYHFYGGVGESKLALSVHYGKISANLAKSMILEDPLTFLKQVSRSHAITFFYGTTFMTGKFYEPQLINLPLVHKLFGFIIAPWFMIGILASYVMVLIKLSLPIYGKNLSYSIRENFPLINNFLPAISAIYIVGTVSIFAFTTCCENGRMIVGVLPLSLIVALPTIEALMNRVTCKIIS